MTSARKRGFLAARILLTLTTLAFFGPIVRDFNGSHVLNPTWVGHARVHVMWLMCFSLFSGLVNLYLIWGRHRVGAWALYVSLAWESCDILGFWASGLSASLYGGETSVAGIHVHVLGIEESTAFFLSMSLLALAAALILVLQARAAPPQRR